MNNLTSEQILVGAVAAFVGAATSAIANAIISLILAGKIFYDYSWVWLIIGLLCAALVIWAYLRYRRNVISYRSRVAIQTNDGNYVTADQNSEIIGRAKVIKAWQTFEIVDASQPNASELKSSGPIHFGNKIALRAVNDKFVSADLDQESDKHLATWNPESQWWETFKLCLSSESPPARNGDVIHYGEAFALQTYNGDPFASPPEDGKFVRYIHNSKNGRLLADADRMDEWTTFKFIDPIRPK
jgi:hypothetical protein